MHNMATQSLLAKILATARDRSAAMMRRFLLDTGDVACEFDSDNDDDDDDDEEDDDNILHFCLVPTGGCCYVQQRQSCCAEADCSPGAPGRTPQKKQDPSTLARIKRTPCGGGTTWQMPHVQSLHSTPTEDWPVYFAVIFKNWWSLLGLVGGPHGMTTMFVGLGNRCPIWN